MIYLILFLEFFKIGLFCFGGAFGMIPLIEETVLKYDWLTESEFYDFIASMRINSGSDSRKHGDVRRLLTGRNFRKHRRHSRSSSPLLYYNITDSVIV